MTMSFSTNVRSSSDDLLEEAPRDKFGLVLVLCCTLGAGCLFAWNALITSVDYFQFLYGNANFAFDMSVAYLPALLLGSLLTLALPSGGQANTLRRVCMGYVAMFAVLVMFAALAAPPYWLSLALSVLLGASDGVAQTALNGFVAVLPSRYISALVSGQAAAGTLVSLLRIATKASFEMNRKGSRLGAVTFFSIAGVVLVVCIVGLRVLPKLRFVEFWQQRASTPRLRNQSDDPVGVGGATVPALCNIDRPTTAVVARSTSLDDSLGDVELILRSDEESEEGIMRCNPSVLPMRSVRGQLETLRNILSPAGIVFVVFLSTLVVFPGVLAQAKPRTLWDGWLPVLVVFVFNLFDLIGRLLTRWHRLRAPPGVQWALVTLRAVVLLPLLVVRSVANDGAPRALRGDAPLLALDAVLGASNGYLVALAMMRAPQLVSPVSKTRAGELMVGSVLSGLVLGAFVGEGIRVGLFER